MATAAPRNSDQDKPKPGGPVISQKQLLKILKEQYTEPGIYRFSGMGLSITFWAVSQAKVDMSSLRVEPLPPMNSGFAQTVNK